MAGELTTKLAQSEQSYRNQFAGSSAVMMLINPTDGAIIDVNAAAVSFYGYPRERMLAMRITDISPKPLAELLQNLTTIRPKQGQRFQSQHRVASGELRDVEVSISYIQFGGRAVLHSIVFDITERKRIEEALQESEMRQHLILTTMAEGLVVQAANGKIIDCNLNAEKIFGLSRDEIMGLTSVDPRWQAVRADGSAFPGEEHPAMVSIRTGQACHDVLMGLHLPDGSKKWININAEPMVKNGETRPYAVVTSFADITARRLIEKELLKTSERLELAAQAGGGGYLGLRRGQQQTGVGPTDVSLIRAHAQSVWRRLRGMAEWSSPG